MMSDLVRGQFGQAWAAARDRNAGRSDGRRTRIPGCRRRMAPSQSRHRRIHFEASHVEEPEPLVLGGPPKGARGAAVERHVDPVVADGVPVRVRDGLVLVLAV